MLENSIFEEEIRDARRRSKFDVKKKKGAVVSVNYGGRRYVLVRASEVLDSLKDMGLNIKLRTLQQYVQEGLAPMPDRINTGRREGILTDYKPETPSEIYASYKLKHDHKNTSTIVRRVRQTALGFDNDKIVPRQFLEIKETLKDAINKAPVPSFIRGDMQYELKQTDGDQCFVFKNHFVFSFEEVERLVKMDDMELLQELVHAQKWLKYKQEALKEK